MDHILPKLHAHLPGVIGFVMTVAGGFMMIWFPADAKGYLKKGKWGMKDGFTIIPTDESDRLYRFYKNGFYAGLVLLIFGALLGLIDYLT
jgi:hypothetical protein